MGLSYSQACIKGYPEPFPVAYGTTLIVYSRGNQYIVYVHINPRTALYRLTQHPRRKHTSHYLLVTAEGVIGVETGVCHPNTY